MPSLLRSLKTGYYHQDSIKAESKDMMNIVSSNLKAKQAEAEKAEKPIEGGAKRAVKKFDKVVKAKYHI